MANDGDVERLALARDSRQALDDLFSATYSELRRLAAAVSRSDRHATINPPSSSMKRARQAAIVETRFFGGLEAAETAELLNVSEATVLRDWRAARAWLARELRGSP